MGEYYGYDYHNAEERLSRRIDAVKELVRQLCGERAKSLAECVCDELYRAMWSYKNEVDKIVAQHQFKIDFGYYLLHECKSIDDAQEWWKKAAAAFDNSKTSPANVAFENWRRCIDNANKMYYGAYNESD